MSRKFTLADYIGKNKKVDVKKILDLNQNKKNNNNENIKRTFPVKLVKKNYYFNKVKDINYYFLNFEKLYIKNINKFLNVSTSDKMRIITHIPPQFDAIEFICQVHQLKYEVEIIDLFYIFSCCQYHNNNKHIKNCSLLYDYIDCDCEKSVIHNKFCFFLKKINNKDYYVYKNYSKIYTFKKSEIKNVIFYFLKKMNFYI